MKTFDVGATDVKFEIWVSGTDTPVWLDFVYMYEGEYVWRIKYNMLPACSGGLIFK